MKFESLHDDLLTIQESMGLPSTMAQVPPGMAHAFSLAFDKITQARALLLAIERNFRRPNSP